MKKPQVLAEAVTVSCKNYAWSVKKDLLASHCGHMREVKTQVVACRYVAHVAPLALLWLLSVNLQNCSNSKSERRLWHQVCNYAFMRFASVNQPELFNALYFNSDTVLKNVLDLLANELITRDNLLLEVYWM